LAFLHNSFKNVPEENNIKPLTINCGSLKIPSHEYVEEESQMEDESETDRKK
jgi:hypothetical protein